MIRPAAIDRSKYQLGSLVATTCAPSDSNILAAASQAAVTPGSMNTGSWSASGSASRMPATACGSRVNCSSGCRSVEGSRKSAATSASRMSAQSATLRAIGPIESSDQLSKPVPCRLIRPNVTFNPVKPLNADGIRTEPPVSLPMPTGANPAATATPVPLEEPPGTRWVARSHGFTGVPIFGFVPQPPNANSVICVLPSGTMPAPSNRSTVAAVAVLTRPRLRAEPSVQTLPSISSRSFRTTGRPCSGERGSPAVRAASAARASALASSA